MDRINSKHTKHNQTHISAPITVRLKNEEIDALEKIRELGDFDSKTEVVKILLRPALAQFVTAINTKSALKAARVRVQEEILMNEKLHTCIKNTAVQQDLDLGIPEMEVALA